MMNKWVAKYKNVYITMGPVFDYNYDGLADDDIVLLQYVKYISRDLQIIYYRFRKGVFVNKEDKITSTPIPTHIFIIAMKCKDSSETIEQCSTSPSSADIAAFLIPNYKEALCGSSSVRI